MEILSDTTIADDRGCDRSGMMKQPMHCLLGVFGCLWLVVLITAGCSDGRSRSTYESDLAAYKNDDTIAVPSAARDTITLNFGSSFGECGGYCITEFEVGEVGIQRTRKSWDDESTAYPPIRTSLQLEPGKVDSLWAQLDLGAFMALPPRIGCPDCADGGAEWIELRFPSGAKRVTFEFREEVPAMAGLVKAIREIRDDPRWPVSD